MSRRDPFADPLWIKFAERLTAILEGTSDEVHEPDQQGLRHVQLVGDHLDNAMGDTVQAKMILEGFQEYVVIIEREPDGDRQRQREPFNLACILALARIGAANVLATGREP